MRINLNIWTNLQGFKKLMIILRINLELFLNFENKFLKNRYIQVITVLFFMLLLEEFKYW